MQCVVDGYNGKLACLTWCDNIGLLQWLQGGVDVTRGIVLTLDLYLFRSTYLDGIAMAYHFFDVPLTSVVPIATIGP
ncbi:hypothetical protein ABVC71_05195 [Prevotella amnii]|nr:hypothetical protein [Prevotella amnii]